MEIPISTYTTFFNELQTFVLRDSDTLQLYRQYLSQSSRPSLVKHIDFYQDMLALEKGPQQTKLEEGDTLITYTDIYAKYFSGGSPEHVLDIKQETIQAVKDNVSKLGSASAFKAAVWVVMKELCYENLTNFTNSDLFQDYKECLRVASTTTEMLNLSPKERIKTVRLRKFFGEQLNTKEVGRMSFRAQPRNVKSYRLTKKFGERVLVEHNEASSSDIQASPRDKTARWSLPTEWRKSRRLHVFFGKSFVLDEVLFSEKIRAPLDCINHGNDEDRPFPKQPDNVHPHRLNRFFGERVPRSTAQDFAVDSDDLSGEQMDTGDEELDTFESDRQEEEQPAFISSRFPKNQRIIRFFGERMDPSKEASYKSFVDQPANVSSLKLKKIFGTPDAAAAIDLNDRNAGTVETGTIKKAKRAHKLHKFFGIKVDEDEDRDCMYVSDEERDHVVPSM